MVGSVIENYKIISVLGEGGMGIVYKALDMKLERFVALKILSSQAAVNPQFIERFKREARNQAKLTHPNIVPVYGFTDDNGLLGIVMEFIEGETLERVIYRKKQMDPTESLDILKQILQGVGYAHSKGFIHRDIKPSNVIISKEGVVKIMDFGISKSMFDKGITKTGTKIGTILYMSPEQIRADEPTRQSDIYSIGVTFYEMLIGKTPFDFGTEYEIMEAHLKKNPGRVSGNLDSIPPEIDKIVAKALEETPIKRYATCEDFLFEIDTIFSKKNKRTSTKSAKKQVNRDQESRSFKFRITLMTVFALSIFTVLAWYFYTAIREFLPNLKKSDKVVNDTAGGYRSNPNYMININWAKLPTNTTNNLNSVYFVDNTNGFACGEKGSVLTTSTAGDEWRTINSPDSITLKDIFFQNTLNGIVVGERGKIYRTQDGGNTWKLLSSGVNESLFRITILANGTGFIVGAKGVLLRSTDNGNTWARSATNTDRLLNNIFFSDNHTGYIVGKDGLLLKSDNAGVSWNQSQLPIDNYLKDVFFLNTKLGFISAGGGEILKTVNAGAEWRIKKTPSSAGLFSIIFIDENSGFAISNKGEIIQTTDGGETWEMKQSSNSYALERLTKTKNNTIFACGYNGLILRSKQ